MPTPATIFIMILLRANGDQVIAPVEFPTMEACTASAKLTIDQNRGRLDPRVPYVCSTASRANSEIGSLFLRKSLGTK